VSTATEEILMRAVTFESFDAAPAVRDDLPDPTAAAYGLVVRVRASSVNPVDNAIAAGMLREMIEHDFPVVLGRDYSGTVEATGADVEGYAVGDEVFGFLLHANPTVHVGSWAELIALAPQMQVAPKPASLDLAAAGVAPLAGIAALAAVDALALSEGETILIVGATGGVGSFAVQLAARTGATIIAPAFAEDADYLRKLGVTEQIDRDGDVVAAVRDRHPDGVDALLDLVSYAPGAFEGALRDGARVASTNGAAGEGSGRSNVMAVPSEENLRRLAALLDDGTLQIDIHDTFELDRATDALQALATQHVRASSRSALIERDPPSPPSRSVPASQPSTSPATWAPA
jgi:NADPH:quinone reductase-like Zn-dependent oxidoreductase